ncbi:MAG: transporter permease [Microbacterium sp.]|jgi:ABC-2 type transport system permease protein|uniref:ABC transporter permease subunit n=1 Tax=Microbacterium sp. TaxID=51671 RepID=UPI002636F8E3|nr:ABC transporter permease subunit [Microbacterium sp.]MDF2563181.1 transporter permease [Microbacterium sp.]
MTAVAVSSGRSMRSPLPVFRGWLAEGWRGLLGWAVGLVAVALVYLPLFPTMQSPELSGLIETLPPELVRTLGYENITSGAGYAQATFFGLIGFVLVTIAGIGWGASFIAGAEESGRLELTLAHGVGRVQYALESAAALTVKLLALGLVALLVVGAVNGPAELELDPVNLLAVTKALVGVGMLSATAALAGGALTGRRIWGVGVGSAIAVGGYVLQAIANNSEDLDWLRAFSPFDWAFGEAPLANGMDWTGLAVLWGGAAVLITLATVGLARRDVLG